MWPQQQAMMGGGMWPQQQMMMGGGMWPQQQGGMPQTGPASPNAGAQPATPGAAGALPEGWKAHTDPTSGKEYYYNSQTKQCVPHAFPRPIHSAVADKQRT
jgi:hypothetical protein